MQQKVFDTHFHVGYFPRKKRHGEEIYYYSPARVMQYIRWAGIDEFIFSSTNVCWGCSASAMHAEALELKRLAGSKAHALFWLSLDYYKNDQDLSYIPDFYEGIKLHGGESSWIRHPDILRNILSSAVDRNWVVQIHTGKDRENSCSAYYPYCLEFPSVHFDLAHGWPLVEALSVLKNSDNIWIDLSFVENNTAEQLTSAYPDKVMFGSDFPAPLRFYDVSGTMYLKEYIARLSKLGGAKLLEKNARDFLALRRKK